MESKDAETQDLKTPEEKTPKKGQFVKKEFDDLSALAKSLEKTIVVIHAKLKELDLKFDKLISTVDSKLIEAKKEHQAVVSSLKESNKIATCAEETLLSVLLAIRQNEYLQAYYPKEKK